MEDQRKNYFSQAYSTGADIWTLHDYREVIEPFVSRLPAGSLVLDLGSGRGHHSSAGSPIGPSVVSLWVELVPGARFSEHTRTDD